MSDKKHFLRELGQKRDLIVNTYGSFLERQTRLSCAVPLHSLRRWEEIAVRRKLLMLDDITVFSIAGRRLIDLCKLQSTCESLKLQQVVMFGENGDIAATYKQDGKIGFYSVLSRLIHMTNFFYFDSKRDFRHAMSSAPDLVARYNELMAPVPQDDSISGFILTRENKHGAIAIRLVDILNASIEAAEKIIEVCSSADISLEAWEREV